MTNDIGKLRRVYNGLSVLAGFLTIAGSVLVLIGWKYNIESLKNMVPGTINMKPNTAAAFLLAGIALISSFRLESGRKWGIRFIASLIIIISILSISRYIFNWEFGFENILFREALGAVDTIYPGLMAFSTAVNFIFLGITFFLLTVSKYKNLFLLRFFVVFSFSVSMLALIGYLTGYTELAGPGSYTKMAVTTALQFMLLCTGMLFMMPSSSGEQAFVERRLFTGLTISFALVIFISFLAIEGMASYQKNTKQNAHTDAILDELNDLIVRVGKIQSSARKFMLTGEEYYRKSHEIGVIHLSRILDTLVLNEADNKYVIASKDIAKRVAVSEEFLSFAKIRASGPDRSMAAVAKENEITDSIRVLLTSASDNEKQILLARNQSEKEHALKTRRTIFAGIIIQLLLILFLFAYVKRDVAGRKKAEESLQQLNEDLEFLVEEQTKEIQQSHKQYHDIVENSPLGICNTGLDGSFIFANQAFVDLMEYDSIADVLEAKSSSLYKNTEDRIIFLKAIHEFGSVKNFESIAITRKQKEKSLLLNAWVDKDIICTTLIDISDQKQAQEKLANINRLYAILSGTNEVIVRVKDRKFLFDEVCRLAVTEGKFKMAWVGLYDSQSNKVLPVASAGATDDYVEIANVDLNDEVRRQGLVAATVLTGVHNIAYDIANNPAVGPWRENALRHGFKSLGCFPISPFGKTVGAFMVYADTPFFFDDNGILLLDEVAGDISFAIEKIENEIKRREHEEDLRKSENRFRSTLDNMIEGCQIIGFDWRYIYINAAAERHNRRPAAELMGNKYVDMWPGIEETEVYKTISRTLEERISQYMENEFTFPDGTVGWFELRIEPVPEGVFILSVDITDKKAADKLLREREARFRSLFENMLNGFAYCKMIYDGDYPRDFKYLDVNKSFEKLTGLKNVNGKLVSEVIPGIREADSELFEVYSRVALTGIPEEIETYVEALQMWFSISVYSPEREYFIAVFDVITKRKLAEAQLKESEEKFRNVFENSPIGKSLTTIDGKLVVNKEFCKMLGYTENELMHMEWEKITHPDDLEKSRLAVAELLNGDKEVVRLQKRYFHKSGSIVWIDMSIYLQRDAKGKPLFFIASANNITDLKLTEIELLEAKEKAEEMNRLKTNFLANMSHELRTPLIGILGFSEILSTELESPEYLQMVRTINESGERLKSTLNMILDLSRVEAKQIQLLTEEVNLVPLVDTCIHAYMEKARTKGLSITTKIADVQMIGKVDKRLFVESINHILKNAVVYTDSGGITVTLSKEVIDHNEWACISVADTGIGIDKKDFELIFEEFRQASEGISRGFEGTGLGLTLVKRYVDLMKGTIKLESEPGVGSNFTVRIPLLTIAEPRSETQSSAEVDSTKPVDRPKALPVFLYVEDDEVSRNVVRIMLQDICRVEMATTGEEAMDLVLHKHYDCILMDINLGKGKDGKLVASAIRKLPQYAKTPIVAVTAFAMLGDKDEFLAAGCSDYISKPFSKQELVTFIKNVLKR